MSKEILLLDLRNKVSAILFIKEGRLSEAYIFILDCRYDQVFFKKVS